MQVGLDQEYAKAFVEYLRFITTLSTGSIILLVTFLEKLFTRPKWKGLVIVSMAGFTLSIIASVIAQTFLVIAMQPKRRLEYWEVGLASGGLLGTWLGFLLGITSLTIFSVKNLIASSRKGN